jgi:hypothetical protein
MEENERITKIIVSKDDELTDIVSGVLGAQTERIIITFAEESDILISPINLSVIKETAEDANKIIICQIIKNPAGERNSALAGITTINTPNNPTEEVWETAKKKEASEEALVSQSEAEPQIKTDHIKGEETSEFEKRINEAIQKNKAEMAKKTQKEYTQDGLVISVGEDLPKESEEEEIPKTNGNKFVDLSKINFNQIKEEPKENKNLLPNIKFPNIFNKPHQAPTKASTPESPLKKKIRRFLPVVGISVLVILILSFVIYFFTSPFVKIRIYVKAQQVSVEETFTGDSNINAIDFTNKKIPIKTETKDESRSSTITATGTAYKGEKASGTVVLINPGKDSSCTTINLPASQAITSSDGKVYTLDNAVSITCSNFTSAAVHATDIGEEYNTSGSYFTVYGYTDSQVFATKSGDFTGGSKTQYTVLSQSDVNTGSDQLKAQSISEIEDYLKNKQGSDWTVIPDSIKTTVDPTTIKTDIAVGAAATQVNLTLTVSGSATYYLSNGFNKGIETLLTQEAQAKNLFQSDQNLELTLSNKLETNVSVVQSTDTATIIKLDATGYVEPKVDKAAIIQKLETMKWAEGASYLDSLKYSNKATEYEFNPVNFPKIFYYFPQRQGGIVIDVVDI